jgi:hypothetical protein
VKHWKIKRFKEKDRQIEAKKDRKKEKENFSPFPPL